MASQPHLATALKTASRANPPSARRASGRRALNARNRLGKTRRATTGARRGPQSLQTDPIGYASDYNMYAYAGNDPVNGIDPSGLCTGTMIQDDNACGSYSGGGPADTGYGPSGGYSQTTNIQDNSPPPGCADCVNTGRAPIVNGSNGGGYQDWTWTPGGEAAVLGLASWGGASAAPGYNINLLLHEAAGGHTIALHIAKSLSFLRRRLDPPRIDTASSFRSLRDATTLINLSLNNRRAEIQAWEANPEITSPLTLVTEFAETTGYSVAFGQRGSTEPHSVFILLKKPALTPEGFVVWTSFPY